MGRAGCKTQLPLSKFEPVFKLEKGALVTNILTVIMLFLSLPWWWTAESSSGSMSKNLEELVILGLQYFWKKKKKCKWFSQDLSCLIRHYYYIWWCEWLERFNLKSLMSYFINASVWRSPIYIWRRITSLTSLSYVDSNDYGPSITLVNNTALLLIG